MPSHSFDVNAGIAQLVEHDLAKVGVASSSLVSRSKFSHECPAGIAQLVEHDLAKVGVASSSLVSRSKFTIPRVCGGFFCLALSFNDEICSMTLGNVTQS